MKFCGPGVGPAADSHAKIDPFDWQRSIHRASDTMQDFEKLGVFYLGREYDWQNRKPKPELLLYDSRDLTTHAVCVGMTGSGKTGLCLALLEEAAIDGIPAIIIDPKGDLGNLLLTFPDLKPDDLKPWLDPADAARKGVTLDQLAEKTAVSWREGLAEWGQDPSRIAKFRDSADIAIYTPGSDAGLPLTVLRSFAPPSKAILENADALRERISAAVSGLLALVGIEADPLRSREHILLSNLLDRAWWCRSKRRPRRPGAANPIAAVGKDRRRRSGKFLPGQGAVRAGHDAEQSAGFARLRRLDARRTARHSASALDRAGQAAAIDPVDRPSLRS